MLVQLTHKCMENCTHCFVNATPDANSFMTFDTFNKAVALAYRCKTVAFQITGGEPTLHPATIKEKSLEC